MPLTQTNLPNYPPVDVPRYGEPLTTAVELIAQQDGWPDRHRAQRAEGGHRYTGRRPIVEDARCNKCHQELGTFTTDAFHGGQRNDGTTCAWCHNPNRTSSGWSGGLHQLHPRDPRRGQAHGAVHLALRRARPRSSPTSSIPGVLRQCETCHLPGTFDFSATASVSALPNRLYRTVATGTFNGQHQHDRVRLLAVDQSLQTSPTCLGLLVQRQHHQLQGFSVSAPAAHGCGVTTLVNSPIAAQCFMCHDSSVERAHMEITGNASIYSPRSVALGKPELCMVCHGPGHIADIKVMHSK